MSYVPIVASLEDVQPIPGADRVVSATARGYRLVVGADREPGDLGVVFPADGVLDTSFALAAGLLRQHPSTGEKLGGMLELPPRIRCLTIRGVRTDALWVPMDKFLAALDGMWQGCKPEGGAFSWDGTPSPPRFRDGDEIGPLAFASGPSSTIRNVVIARKYLPLVRAQRSGGGKGAPPLARQDLDAARASLEAHLPAHYDTPSAHRAAYRLPLGARVWATEKLHGESGGVALAVITAKLPRWKRVVNRVASVFGRRPYVDDLVALSRTRRVLHVPGGASVAAPPCARRNVRDWLAPRLRPGEAAYFELVGYHATGSVIQKQRPKRGTPDGDKLAAAWGDEVRYSYGCAPDGVPVTPGQPYPQVSATGRPPQQRVFVYRMTRDGREVPFEEMRRRVAEIGCEPPPLLGSWDHLVAGADEDGTVDSELPPDVYVRELQKAAARRTLRKARELIEPDLYAHQPIVYPGGYPSLFDSHHPMEGVVLRTDEGAHVGTPHRTCKLHAHAYLVLQGHGKDRGEVDAEEAEALALGEEVSS